jgi:cytochrome d ubiquinol oxidase subunit II
VLGFIALISIATPLIQPSVAARWFSLPNLIFLSPVPLLTGALALFLLRAVRREFERQPFLLTLALFALAYLGLAISLWPHIVPPAITLWDAAASPASMRFVLAGLVILVPVILAYTGFTYWVFRGKVKKGYEH